MPNGKVNCTHHHMDGKVLRKRTDTLTETTAGRLIVTLRGLGYKNTSSWADPSGGSAPTML